MNIEDQKRIAKAKLRLAKMNGNKEEITQLEEFLLSYNKHIPTTQVNDSVYTPPTSTNSEAVQAIINDLISRKGEIDAKKSMLSNMLISVPETDDCPELVTEILNLRNLWRETNAKIKFVQQHGHLPEQVNVDTDEKGKSNFLSAIEVKELWQIKEDIDNCSSNLSKAKKQYKNVSDATRKLHYQKKIAELEWKLSNMRTLYNAKK
jgi:hypothetical protein